MKTTTTKGGRRMLRRLAREDGLATSAIGIPGVFLLVVLALQMTLWFTSGNVAANAAAAAYSDARAFEAAPGAGTTAANTLINQMDGFLENSSVRITRTATTVTVTVTGRAPSLLPGVELPVVERVFTGPIERWVPASLSTDGGLSLA